MAKLSADMHFTSEDEVLVVRTKEWAREDESWLLPYSSVAIEFADSSGNITLYLSEENLVILRNELTATLRRLRKATNERELNEARR